MRLPTPSGPVSSRVIDSLMTDAVPPRPTRVGDGPVTGDRDLQLALWTLYELSYRGFEGVHARREWDIGLIRLRLDLEDRFESELRAVTRDRIGAVDFGGDVAAVIFGLVRDDDGPHLSSYLRRDATLEQMRDFLRERSVQQLKESDPQSFLLPRLEGAAKVALAELQYDEFGAGQPDRLHQTMYAQTLAAVGLDPGYGAYIDTVSAVSLASANVMSMFALNRRLVAAGAGHFAAFEAASSVPSRRIAAGLDRLGLTEATDYFDEHVEADAVHEQVAAGDLCGSLVESSPALVAEVMFGAACAVHLDGLSGRELLSRWGVDSDADMEVAS
jgi:hypothetical protein